VLTQNLPALTPHSGTREIISATKIFADNLNAKLKRIPY